MCEERRGLIRRTCSPKYQGDAVPTVGLRACPHALCNALAMRVLCLCLGLHMFVYECVHACM